MDKLNRFIEDEVNSWISFKKGNGFIDEMGIAWLKKCLKDDVAFWIAKKLSLQLSDLKKEIEKHDFSSQYLTKKRDIEIWNTAVQSMRLDILSLLDKKGGGEK